MNFSNLRCLRRTLVLCAGVVIVLLNTVSFRAQQQPNRSPIAPLRHPLPSGPLSAGEKIIPLPNSGKAEILNEEQRILHILNRAGFGPRPGDVERIRRMGLDRYLDEQLNPEQMSEDFLSRPLMALNTLHLSIPETIQMFSPSIPTPTPTPTPAPAPAIPEVPKVSDIAGNEAGKSEAAQKPEMNAPAGSDPEQPAMKPPVSMQQNTKPAPTPAPKRDPQQPLRELQQAKILRASFSEKQLQEVMVDFWFNHFNVFAAKNLTQWMVTTYERDVIRPHALGKFQDLLIGVAQNPAMLYYLDNYLSQAERPPRMDADGNEIPVRRPGLNENFARELMELHTLGVDGGYTQQDVVDVARCFTGWTITPSPNATFVFRPRIHDRGEKHVLGNRIPAGGGIEDGLRVLHLLSRHPSTARFIATKLSKRFVSDNPPASLVERAAGVFKNTDGDIREVVRTILTSPEFFSVAAYRNKIKSPFETVVSSIRATAGATDAGAPLLQWLQRMGGPLYLVAPPTGYAEESKEWLSSSTLLERMNFTLALMSNRIRGTTVTAEKLVDPEAIRNHDRLIDELTAVLIHSEISRGTRNTLTRFMKETSARLPEPKTAKQKNDQRRETISGLAALMLGSQEFQMK